MNPNTVAAFIGLGSNLDDPAGHICQALEALAELPDTRLAAHSSLYRSPPMGPPDQPDYINAVAELHTALAPEHLLDHLHAIEQQHGRERTEHWGPRTLDLDLLLYGDQKINTSRLTVPHAGMRERAFVLYPLQEIAPEVMLPGSPEPVPLAQCIQQYQAAHPDEAALERITDV